MANVLDFSMRYNTLIHGKKKFIHLFSISCLFFCFFSCEAKPKINKIAPSHNIKGIDKERLTKRKTNLKQDSIFLSSDLVDIQSVDPSIQVDLKYATSDNFMGIVLYENTTKLFLQKEVAIRLARCQAALKKEYPHLSLLVYDGVRPLSVQQKMWDALDSIPVAQRTKFVSNPANGSIHNYGAAVDLTICNQQGIPLDMGAGYDDIREIAYPRFESRFLASGELSAVQVENRKLLRKIMKVGGFTNIETEWWHFNAYTRLEAKKKYKILN